MAEHRCERICAPRSPGQTSTLLAASTRRDANSGVQEDGAVGLAGDVELQATHDLPLALALLRATRATYCCVRRSRSIRDRQTMYSARLASLLPDDVQVRAVLRIPDALWARDLIQILGSLFTTTTCSPHPCGVRSEMSHPRSSQREIYAGS